MSAQTHPSSEALSGFIDRELPAESRAGIEAHLAECAECRGLVEAFTFMNAMGPAVEEQLPGEAYWADLPDRVLVRIAQDTGEAAPAREPARASWWRRLLQPEGALRYAMGTAAAVVVVAGAWTVIHRQQGVTEPGGATFVDNVVSPPVGPSMAGPGGEMLVSNAPAIPFGASSRGDAGDGAPGMSPESFARRVIDSLGGPNDLGTSLDISSASNGPSRLMGGGIGTQVDYSLPPLSPQVRAQVQDHLNCGPGTSWLETAYICALKAEEVGNTALARQGYRVVLQNTDPGSALNWESGYRLTYYKWRDRILASTSGAERAQALADLSRMASVSYSSWASSGGMSDCQAAWCLNRAFSELAVEMTTPTEQQQAASRTGELSRCLAGQ